MNEVDPNPFDPAAFLASAGIGRRIVRLVEKEAFFTQGDSSDCLFYLHSGRAKFVVVSSDGKEATIALLSSGGFVGEECVAATGSRRLGSVVAITPCAALRIERSEMLRILHQERAFSDMFVNCLLQRILRSQSDLVDQLFNSSEKRLARLLLLLAGFGSEGEPKTLVPAITQQTLAEIVGTTRSRVSYFMNRFRKMGFIEYNGRIRVHESLLIVLLHDQPQREALHPLPHVLRSNILEDLQESSPVSRRTPVA